MVCRVVVVILILACAGPANAQGLRSPLPWLFGTAHGETCPSVGCCRDDYERKCLTIEPAPRCGGPDDYCRKPIPCIGDIVRVGCPYDYCRKPLPSLLCPPWSPFLSCGPLLNPCAPKARP